MKTQNNDYIVCLLDLMDGRNQNGIFILRSPSDLGRISALFGCSRVLKKALGLRWEINITRLPAAGHRNKLLAQHTIGAVIRAVIDKINNKICDSSIILLPPNTPAR